MPLSPPPPSPPPLPIGYIIAISLAALILLSSLLLSLYLCRKRRNLHAANAIREQERELPRIIFVAEEEDEENGVVGLDMAIINTYPKFPYKKSLGCDITCAICLCEYRENEMLRMLPDCRHMFHLCCVDSWLKLNASCPVCRSSPLPTPLSTPLSELVPLSQYSNGRRQR